MALPLLTFPIEMAPAVSVPLTVMVVAAEVFEKVALLLLPLTHVAAVPLKLQFELTVSQVPEPVFQL